MIKFFYHETIHFFLAGSQVLIVAFTVLITVMALYDMSLGNASLVKFTLLIAWLVFMHRCMQRVMDLLEEYGFYHKHEKSTSLKAKIRYVGARDKQARYMDMDQGSHILDFNTQNRLEEFSMKSKNEYAQFVFYVENILDDLNIKSQ
jgi:hypothetical protein